MSDPLREALGHVPYLPTHNHAAGDACPGSPLCPHAQWATYVERFGSPFPCARSVEPEYEYRAAREGLTGVPRDSLQHALRSAILRASPRGWIERRVKATPGPWERVE